MRKNGFISLLMVLSAFILYCLGVPSPNALVSLIVGIIALITLEYQKQR